MSGTGAQASRTEDSWLRKMGIYSLHLLIAVVGVFAVGALVEGILEAVFSLKVAGAVFEGPVFYGQIGFGFLLGYTLNQNLRSKLAMWVWVLPAVWLIWAIRDALNTAWGGGGLGCLLSTKSGDCALEQLIMVCPFYSSVAYSLGSWARLGRQP